MTRTVDAQYAERWPLPRPTPRTYAVVRHYFDRWPNRRTIARGLTLAEAQAHCNDPETSSSTATSATGRRRTARLGPWFDGYTEERSSRA